MDAIRREIDGLKDAGMSFVAVVAVISPFVLAIGALVAIIV